MANAAQLLIRRSTNVIELTKLKDNVAGVFVTDATVVCTLFDENGAPVSGVTALPMPYVVGTIGSKTLYRGIIASDVDLSGDTYTARITVTHTGGVVRELNVACTAIDG